MCPFVINPLNAIADGIFTDASTLFYRPWTGQINYRTRVIDLAPGP